MAQDQAVTKICTKIEPYGGKSELAAAGMSGIGYSDGLKAGALSRDTPKGWK
jgi:hypothetical protein